MTELKMVLDLESGLHARPASQLIQSVNMFKSNIVVSKDGKQYNVKSMMSILSMEADKGTVLTFEAEGPDEKDAIGVIKNLFESGFQE